MNTTDIKKQGFLRRLKTLKRRYFVIRTSSKYGKPRLEYYESEKKFRSKAPPKRLIYLASCFNIAQKDDTKHKFVFSLYTREDAFGLVCESQDELKSWMNALLKEQKVSENISGNEYSPNDGGLPKSFSSSSMRREYDAPTSHVSSWQVTVQPRGLGTSKHLAGTYLLQLANQTLSLVKIRSEEVAAEFNLMNVRRCGHTDCFFFMEVGRSSMTGAGELWMQVDDPILALNLHEVVLLAMQSLSGDTSSLARYRCHSGGHKKRPTSLLLQSPTRARSDTDSSLHKHPFDVSLSPTKHPEENSPAQSKTSTIFQRLRSVGKKRTEDTSPRLFSRRTQSKSLSIEPGQGGLLGRAQSLDFSRLFSGAELNSPGSPESPNREINFDIDEEPGRTSSNSSGSSGRSWEQSHTSVPHSPHKSEGRDITDEGYDSTRARESTPKDVSASMDGNPLCITTPSNDGKSPEEYSTRAGKSTPKDVSASMDGNPLCITTPSNDGKSPEEDSTLPDEGSTKINSEMPSDDGNEKSEEQENSPENVDFDTVITSESDNPEQARISRTNRSRYEDMSLNFENLSLKEKTDDNDLSSDESQTPTPPKDHLIMPSQDSPKQRRTSEPAVATSSESHPMAAFPVDHVSSQTKSSPKQRRTSEPAVATSSESHPMAAFPVDRVSSQTKSSPKQRRTSEPVTPSIYELRELVQIKNSPSSSPRRSKKNVSSLTSTNGTIAENPDSESDSPSSSRRRHNNKGKSTKASDEYELMTPHTGSHTYVNMTPGEGLKGSEDEPAYMNFRPGEMSTSEQNTEEHSYMNFQPGKIPGENTGKESPSYMNFRPGSVTRSESVSPRPQRKHAYENLNSNGTLKVNEDESHDYMNFSPLGNSEKDVHRAKSIPSSHGSYGNLLNPALLNPASGEESRMFFLDFTKKTKPKKGLNYVSLDLSKGKKVFGGKGVNKKRPSSVNTTPCQKMSWDTGPKSAPLETGYAEIDFAKSRGLQRAILEHEKTKPQKE